MDGRVQMTPFQFEAIVLARSDSADFRHTDAAAFTNAMGAVPRDRDRPIRAAFPGMSHRGSGAGRCAPASAHLSPLQVAVGVAGDAVELEVFAEAELAAFGGFEPGVDGRDDAA